MSRFHRAVLVSWLGLWVAALAGCTKPTVRVCRGVSAEGVCEAPPGTLLVGKPYVVHATGAGLPTGRVRVVLSRWVGRERETVASVTLDVAPDATYFTNPLLIPRVGSYRITILDAEGGEFRHVDVRAPDPAVEVRPAPPPAR